MMKKETEEEFMMGRVFVTESRLPPAADLLCCRRLLCCPCGQSGLPGRAAGSTEALCLPSPAPRRDNQDMLVDISPVITSWPKCEINYLQSNN